jgi:membrane protein YqaA with SNARE-associated domain
MSHDLIAMLAVNGLKHWLFRLGGIGLILVALVDNSFIPLPGGLDVFTIVLSAGHHELWPYYAIMATVGSVIGAYLTYRIGEKGGQETLEKKIGKQRAEKVYRKFEHAGFLTVVVGCLIPPPFPIVPVLLAAGGLRYPRNKFLGAVAVGRSVRYTLDAILGVYYGRAILGFFGHYYKPFLYALIVLGAIGGTGAWIYYKHWKHKEDRAEAKARGGRTKEKVA